MYSPNVAFQEHSLPMPTCALHPIVTRRRRAEPMGARERLWDRESSGTVGPLAIDWWWWWRRQLCPSPSGRVVRR